MIEKLKRPINSFYLKESGDLAELISIILGDGHIYDRYFHYSVSVYIGVTEPDYINYVKNLIEKLFNITPSYYLEEDKKGRVVRLRVSRKAIVKFLISKGLKSGDKVSNQVCVPPWIANKIEFVKRSLKGLVDTDGTLAPSRRFRTITINFSNASLPLVKNFKDMCKSLDIKTSKIIGPVKKVSQITGKISKQYVVTIQAKDQVKRFIELIKPKKWDYRSEMILNAIGKTYEEALEYVKSPYNLEKALEWKILLERKGSTKKLISYLKKRNKFAPTEKSFKIWMESLLGVNGYQQWLRYNSNLLLDDELKKIFQFPQQLRILVCSIIFDLIIRYKGLKVSKIRDVLEVQINEHELLKRLSYLLNNSKSRNIILDYLVILIKFIKRVKKEFDLKNQILIRKIKRELKLPMHPSYIKEIIEHLRKNYGEKLF